MQLHPQLGNNESPNRQRENRNRKPNNRRWQDLRFKEIQRTSSKNRCIRKQQKTQQIKLDLGKRELPKVVESDNVSIKPRKEKGNIGNKSFHQAVNSYSDRLIDERARILLSKEGAIKWIDKGLFSVQSQTGIGRFRVEWNGNKWICKCPYFTKNNKDCKHILAVQYYLLGYVTIH